MDTLLPEKKSNFMCTKIKTQDKDRRHRTYCKKTILDIGIRGLT